MGFLPRDRALMGTPSDLVAQWSSLVWCVGGTSLGGGWEAPASREQFHFRLTRGAMKTLWDPVPVVSEAV